MSSNFKVGSISDIINSTPSSKKKQNKKQKSPKSEQQFVVVDDDKEELAKPKNDTKPASLKRKTSESDAPEATKVAKTESPTKKKQKGKRLPKANSVPKVEPTIAKKEETSEEDEPEEAVSSNKNEETELSSQEKLSRTLFIGNLPVGFVLKDLKKILSQFGSVASIRVRCVAPAKETLSKKVAFLSKQINPNKKNVNVYAVFKSNDAVQKAMSLNGTDFGGNVIQVDSVEKAPVYENSIFIGNLSFKTTDNELREYFKDCGDISSVRLVRDSQTGIGKGFGYVNFKNKDSVVLALEKNEQTFNGREIRVKPYKFSVIQKQKGKKEKKSKFQKPSSSPISPKRAQRSANGKPNNKAGVRSKLNKRGPPADQKKEFKGELATKQNVVKKSKKNRIKSSKINKQKKKIAEILSK